jgi:RNA polymerase sigma factor (sigma-70 family)
MSTARAAALLQYIRHLAGTPNPLSDRELLRRFAVQRDESAFAALVQRHGPMVLNVCRRILHRPEDTEDAFQATFLVLLRKAGTQFWHDSIGGWLHRVAARIALRVRADVARRAAEVRTAEESILADPLEQLTARELLAAFDEELARLPDKYREPLILCHLEGQTQETAARQLGLSLSTVRRRLERGRQRLHLQLTRRGLALPAALGIGPAMAAVPASLRAAALQAVSGGVSARAVVLADGVMKAAALTSMKAMATTFLILGVLAAGAGLAAPHFLATKPLEDQPPANAPPEKPKNGQAKRTDLYGDPLPLDALVRMGTVRFRNRGFIGTVAFSPDGKVLAAGGYGGAILLYDPTTGRKLRELHANTNARSIPALAFAPDGKTLASIGFRIIQIWDTATGKELRHFKAEVSNTFGYGFAHPVPFVYSHDGKSLASVASDHSVRVWDAKNGKELANLKGHRSHVHCLTFSTDGKMLFSADGESNTAGSARVWTLATGEELKKFPLLGGGEKKQPGTPLCFTPDGKTLAFAAHERSYRKKGNARLTLEEEVVSFLDLDTGEMRRSKLEPQEVHYQSAVFSRDGKSIATMNPVRRRVEGGINSLGVNRIAVWDAATGKQLFAPPAYAEHFDDIRGPNLMAFAPDGKKLAAATLASSLRVWDLGRDREQLEKSAAHQNMIQCVTFSPDGRILASASSDSTIALWDAATGRQRLPLRGHIGTVTSLAFSPDGKRLASASSDADQTVRLWDIATGKELRRYGVPMASIGKNEYVRVNTWVTFTANGKVLAAGGSDRKARLWDVAIGKEIRNQTMSGLRTPPNVTQRELFQWPKQVIDVAFTPDGRVMALCAGDIVSIVDVDAAQPLFQFERKGFPAILALSPDGKTLLHGTGKSFRLIETTSGTDLHQRELNGEVFGATFSSDGRTVAVSAGDSDATIHLFDVQTGEEILHFRGHDSRVRSLAFSPDGTKLASGQWDSTALVWDVSATRRKLPRKDLAPRDLERLWTELRDADAAKAHAALWTLTAAPDQVVPFLKEHLRPVPHVAADRLRRLLADLDAEDFARREDASRELARLGFEVEPALRRILDGKPSLEMRRRVEALLRDLSCQTAMTPDALRQLRAIQTLEQIGSAGARQILTSLAEGAPAAPATRDAKAALTRLAAGTGRRPPSP